MLIANGNTLCPNIFINCIEFHYNVNCDLISRGVNLDKFRLNLSHTSWYCT